MEVKEIIKENHEKVIDVICDCCGKSCKVHEYIVDNDLRHDYGQTNYIFEYMEMSADWGYFSNKDTQSWNAQICEKCVEEKFSFVKFKIIEY